MTAFLSALAVAAVLLFWGSQDAAGDMAIERGALWALAILAFPFIYGWHFIKAPAILDRDRQTKIHEISANIDNLSAQLEQKKVPTRRETITLAAVTLDYLEQLTKRGTHGSEITGVIRTLVEEGVRNAIRDGFIEVDENAAKPKQ